MARVDGSACRGARSRPESRVLRTTWRGHLVIGVRPQHQVQYIVAPPAPLTEVPLTCSLAAGRTGQMRPPLPRC